MNRLVLLAIVLFALVSFTLNKSGNKDFTLVSAIKQTTYGGVAGSPSMTRYVVKLKALRNFTLLKDSAYAEGKMEAFEIQADSFTATDKKIVKKGNIITVGFTLISQQEIGGANYPVIIPGSPVAKCPIVSKTGVVIRYKGGLSKYLDITKVQTQETIFAP